MSEALYEHEQAKAKERQREAGKKTHGAGPGRGKTASGKVPEAVLETMSAILTPPDNPPTRDIAAAAVGWSGKTYAKAKAVVHAGAHA